MAACGTPSRPRPLQFPRNLRAAPTLPGLANPPLEAVPLARLSSVHFVKRSVCPKKPVNTCISDLLHSTANVKPHYPPWMESQTQLSPMVTKLGPRGARWCAVWRQAPHFWSAAEGFVPDYVRHKAKKSWHSFFEFAQIADRERPVLVKMNWNCSNKLSTGYIHAAELNKVWWLNFL